jgi:hypothetical protein
MSSRKEEKERLRQEREAAEKAARAAETRRKRIAMVLGGALAVAVAVIVLLAVLGGDDDTGGGGGNNVNAAVPKQQTDDLDEAVRKAGCKLTEHEDEGNEHLQTNEDTFDDYKSNPPTSGTHRPVAAADGVYEPGNSPEPENWVHTLEHGRIIFMYRTGTPENRRNQLETLMNESFGEYQESYKTVVMENNTDMDGAVAAVSWTRSLVCPQFTDAVFDAFRAFRVEFVDQSPEPEFPWPYSGT